MAFGGWGIPSPAAAAEDANEFGGLAAGKGREQVFAYCGACHSLRLVLQQRLTRGTWDDTLVYMVEEQAMPKIDLPDRKLMLDDLGKYLGRDVPRRIP